MNFWRVAEQQWFGSFNADAESLIIGRMVKSRQDGILSEGGLTGLGSLDATPADYSGSAFSNQYLAYANGLTFGAYTTYNSQIGVQGMVYSLLDRLLGLPSEDKLRLFHALASLFSAAALSAIVLWFYLEFGLIVALAVLGSAIGSHWVVVFGRNLWWSFGAFYLPMIAVMYCLRHRRALPDVRLRELALVVIITVFVKCALNGYEYITSALVMMVVPLVYYSILNRSTLRRFLAGLTTAGISSCAAILLSMLVLCFQVGSVEGSFQDGVDHIATALSKRTYGIAQDLPAGYVPSLESSVTDVLATYLQGSFFEGNRKYITRLHAFLAQHPPRVRYWHLIPLSVIASGGLCFLGRSCADGKQRDLALLGATWFSILAPLSWFVVFNAHSYVHTHIDYIVWHMPFVLFGFAVCGLVVKNLLSNLVRQDE